MNTVTLVFVFTEVMQCLHEVIYQQKFIMHVECGRAVFWQALKVQHDVL